MPRRPTLDAAVAEIRAAEEHRAGERARQATADARVERVAIYLAGGPTAFMAQNGVSQNAYRFSALCILNVADGDSNA